MTSQTTFKCLHCNGEQRPDARNRGRQRYCAKPECQRASKAASQRRWLGRAENENYFRGAENSERVRAWRKANPGYWRNKKPPAGSTLQGPCVAQGVGDEPVAPPGPQFALQDLCILQPALLVGLISVVTGHALQEDIAASARVFLSRGEDILRMVPRSPPNPQNPPDSNHENQTHPVPRTVAARASPV